MSSALPKLSDAALAHLLHHLPAGVAVRDGAGRIVWANETLARQLSASTDDLEGVSFDELPLSPAGHQDANGRLLRVEDAPEGETEWVVCLELPLPEQDDVARDIAMLVDATELERCRGRVDRLNQALRGQVATDSSTGLLTRRAIMNQLEAQVSRSRRYQNPLSVLLLELRCRSGGADGPSESVVVEVSRLLRDQTRWPDIIGRWTEQQFLLVLPETSAEAAGVLRDKVADRLRSSSATGGDDGCETRFSIAEWSKGDAASDLLQHVGNGVAHPN